MHPKDELHVRIMFMILILAAAFTCFMNLVSCSGIKYRAEAPQIRVWQISSGSLLRAQSGQKKSPLEADGWFCLEPDQLEKLLQEASVVK